LCFALKSQDQKQKPQVNTRTRGFMSKLRSIARTKKFES
jgi:hypothetical protein